MANPDLGTILTYFHQHDKTTALLCHGPIALLSATNNPGSYQRAMRNGDVAAAKSLSSDWPYHSYRMTIFSDDEEQQASKNVFHGEPQFLPADALATAGGTVSVAATWHPNTVQDRELITGQNPFSDSAMMDLVLARLQSGK
jgi:putative intracellular protease/amidase